MNAGYLSAGAIIAMLGLWSVERSTEQAASADRRIVELLEIANQKQCVKDAKAAGSPLGQRFIDGVALTDLGSMWDASEDVARLQSHWPAGLGGNAVRSAQDWIASNSGSKLGVALAVMTSHLRWLRGTFPPPTPGRTDAVGRQKSIASGTNWSNGSTRTSAASR